MDRMSSLGQPTRGDPPALGLDEVPTTHHRTKKITILRNIHSCLGLAHTGKDRCLQGLVGKPEGKKDLWKTQD
jgi:hypothetical protein